MEIDGASVGWVFPPTEQEGRDLPTVQQGVGALVMASGLFDQELRRIVGVAIGVDSTDARTLRAAVLEVTGLRVKLHDGPGLQAAVDDVVGAVADQLLTVDEADLVGRPDLPSRLRVAIAGWAEVAGSVRADAQRVRNAAVHDPWEFNFGRTVWATQPADLREQSVTLFDVRRATALYRVSYPGLRRQVQNVRALVSKVDDPLG